MIQKQITTLKMNGTIRRGIQIGDWLLILPHPYAHLTDRKIYKLSNQKPLSNTVLPEKIAIAVCEKYIKIYSEFFDLWREYPDSDIHRLARYTIPNGLELCDRFERIFK